jgi:hypothetical protein
MRVRDIVRNSFDLLVETGALPAYQRRGRYAPSIMRHNPVWRPEHLESTHYAAASGPLYEDDAAWRKAVDFVRAFTAARAGRGTFPWRLPAWGGSFGEVPAEDLLHHLTSGFGAFGLRPASANTIAHTAWLEATDSAAVSALPEPYGRWLQLREARPRWREKVELRLAARTRARIAMRPDGRFDAFADIALSAPAVFVIENLASALDRRRLPAPGAARRLPRH